MKRLPKVCANVRPFDHNKLVVGKLYVHWKNQDNSVHWLTSASFLSRKVYNLF